MSLHLRAEKGQYADAVLLPGCPNRARFIADEYLENVELVNDVRGALGFSGKYKNKSVSVQTSGMGMPSMTIYAHELLADYGVKKLIRVGTCGTIQDEISVRDVILAQSASTDSAMNKRIFTGQDFAPCGDFSMLRKARDIAADKGLNCHVGGVLTSDTFYDLPDFWKVWAEHGVLAVEMETSALYTVAAKFRAKALSIVTVSDHIIRGEAMSADDRERSLRSMLELALETATAE